MHFQAEGTLSGLGGPEIGRCLSWLVGAKKPKTESPGLGFGKQNMGGALFWVEGIWTGPGKHGCEEGGGGSLAGMQSGD